MTLTLTAQEPAEHQKRSWTVPAEYRNKNDAKVAVVQLAFEQGAIEFLQFSGEPPPEGYKVELPPPREAKKAKRKATDPAENEDGNPKKKPKMLSQTGQFLAATGLSHKPVQQPQPPSATPMFLPRPGYVDSKPEPGELPDEPPVLLAPRRPPSSFQRSREQQLLPPPPPAIMEPRNRQPRGPYDYGVREHGYQYELGVGGGARYDDPGVYARDPYYAPSPPPPAPYTEPWHARPPYPPTDHDSEEEYRRAYYGTDCTSGGGYDYDYYARHNTTRYRDTPPPETAHDAHDYAYAHARRHEEYEYAHMPPALRRTQQRSPSLPPLLWPQSPSPPPDLLQRRLPPPPSPPRIWQPGPHAQRIDPPPAAPTTSTLGSSSAHHLRDKAPAPVSEPTTYTPSSCKEELIGTFVRFLPARTGGVCDYKARTLMCTCRGVEYCKAGGYPCPQFFDALLDEKAVVDATANPRYKVWIVLGQERLELPTTYANVEDGEEKLARKVLQRLRAQDVGKAKESA